MIDSADNTQFKTGETVSDTAYYKDGAGAWAALAITDTFSEIGTTGIYEITLTAAEMNHDQIIIKMTSTNGTDNSIAVSTIPSPSNLKEIDDDSVVGNLATLTLKQLDIQNSADDAVKMISTDSDGYGLNIQGHGGALYALGTGGSGFGIKAQGGASVGHGMHISAPGDVGASYGLLIERDGQSGASATGAAMRAVVQNFNGQQGNAVEIEADTTGHGIYALSGDGATGDGIHVESQATLGNGIYAEGTGTTGIGIYGYGNGANADGISGQSSSDGDGISGYSNGTGSGILARSEQGAGLQAHGSNTSGNNPGLWCRGGGTGSGIYAISGSGATGDGFKAESQATAGHGIEAIASGNANAIRATASGSEAAIRAANSSSGNGMDIIGAADGLYAEGGQLSSQGHGIHVLGGETVGSGTYHAIYAEVNATGNNGDGMRLAGASNGRDIYADEIGAPYALADGSTAASLADMLSEMAETSAAGATYDRTTDSLQAIRDRGDAAWTTGAITSQAVRDAMKLAPSGGAPAAGSIDEHLDDILTDTGTTIPAQISGLNDLSAAQVNAEVDTALADIKLDHLVAVADSDDVVDDSIIAKLAAKGGTADWSTFDNTTDSLEAIRDRGDAAWASAAAHPDVLEQTTITGLVSQTVFNLTAGSADDDAYNGALAVITDSATATQKAVADIESYVGATKTVTLLADPAVFTMANGDNIAIIAKKSSMNANIKYVNDEATNDGVDWDVSLKKMQSVLFGKCIRSGGNFKYRDQADSSDLVDYDVSATGRTIN